MTSFRDAAKYDFRSGGAESLPGGFLNKNNTANAVTIVGIMSNMETVRHSNPSQFSAPIVNPASATPTITGAVVLPICAPVRCAAIANPRRFGYRAASAPNAGACHIDVPTPIITAAISNSQYQSANPTSR